MSDLDLPALMAIAEAATPGHWRVIANDGAYVKDEEMATLRIEQEEYPEMVLALIISDTAALRHKANAAHIAAFDPPTVIALLDRLSTAEVLISLLVDGLTAALAMVETPRGGPPRWDLLRELRKQGNAFLYATNRTDDNG